MNSKTRIYLLALGCLVLGAMLYVCCRINILFVDWLHLNNALYVRLDDGNPFVYWVVYCLPDALWYMALLLVQHQILLRDSLVSRLCVWIAVLLPFGIEGLQACHWIGGTFDWYDMLTYLLTLILFCLCVRKSFSSLAFK